MRITFDVSYVQKNRAGIGRHALQLIKALCAANSSHQFVLHGWSFGIDREPLASIASPNVRLSVAKIAGDVKRFYWNKLRFPTIETIAGACDIFHSADPLLPSVKRAKTICTVHDLAYKKFPEMFEPRVPAWNEYVERSVRTANCVIVPSLQTKTDLIQMMNVDERKIEIVQLPPSAAFSSSSDPECDKRVTEKFFLTNPYVLAVGTIEPRKNLFRLLKAFRKLQSEGMRTVDVVIVGKKGWMYEDVFESVGTKSEGVHFLDYVAEEDLAALYRRALCFVYPSIYEGYGFPVLEAMASGTPIITSNNSSLREIADGVALLIDPLNTLEIADAIRHLVGDEVRRVEMRSRGFQVIQHFTAERAAQKVLAIYDSLAS